jgi:hypothetical protein
VGQGSILKRISGMSFWDDIMLSRNVSKEKAWVTQILDGRTSAKAPRQKPA